MEQETSERKKPKEAYDAAIRFNRRTCGRAFYGVGESLGKRGQSETGSNFVRDPAFERMYGAMEGSKPRRENPKSGIGMK